RPSMPEPRYNRGNAREAAGDLEGAIADYTAVIDAGKGSVAKARNNRATARAALGDASGALDDFAEALRLDPPNPDVHYNRGLGRAAAGDAPGALRAVGAALEAAPRDGPSRADVERVLREALGSGPR